MPTSGTLNYTQFKSLLSGSHLVKPLKSNFFTPIKLTPHWGTFDQHA